MNSRFELIIVSTEDIAFLQIRMERSYIFAESHTTYEQNQTQKKSKKNIDFIIWGAKLKSPQQRFET